MPYCGKHSMHYGEIGLPKVCVYCDNINLRVENQRLRGAALWIINNWVCDREDGTISEDLCGRYNLCRRCSLIKALEGGE